MDIATVSYPPENVLRDINKLRHLISEKFNTVRSFDWEPHITIADKVNISDKKMGLVFGEIEKICQKTKLILVHTRGLRFLKIKDSPFENPYVIFIGVRISKELQGLHDTFQNKIYKDFEKPGLKWDIYKPHITLAYRDLTKENFVKAKKFFQNRKVKTSYSFYLDNIYLMSMKNNKIKELKKFKFRKK